MTFREKLKEEYPGKINENCAGGCEGCPSQYGYEERYDCKNVTCKDCWNREMPLKCPNSTRMMNRKMPNTEPLTDNERKIDFMSENAYNKGLNDGRNEAWGLARTLYDKKVAEVEKIFDVDGGFWAVIRDFTPQEALAKLKAYEEAQIEVGDVVTYSGERGMVLDSIPSKFVVLTHDGWVQEWYKCDVEKTGKHIALDGLLEQIGGITWE